LPGLKLKKPAINLMAYFWHGLGCNSRYIETILDIDLRILNDEVYRKYQDPITNKKGVKIAAPDLRKDHQVEFLEVLLSSSHRSLGFRNKDLKQILTKDWKTAQIAYELRKLRERGAVKKLQSSHYYQLTKDKDFENPDQASIIEGAYSDINRAVSLIASEFKLVS